MSVPAETSNGETVYDRTSGPIHTWFELTYSNYQVLPRVLMQSMPVEWQERMVACLVEMREAFRDVDKPEAYKVEPGAWHYPGDLDTDTLTSLGIDVDTSDWDNSQIPSDQQETRYYDQSGTQIESGTSSVFVPGHDPLPHYRRGYVEPRPAGGQS